jgi:aminoglycoside 6-adenylyltransferase
MARSENEMLELILTTARSDERIRAVVLNGSRANPQAQQDIFQDFDIVYFVTNVESFTDEENWIHRFGDIMILQTPEAKCDPPPLGDGRFTYLMQFMDGNRIDLTLFSINRKNDFRLESATLLLLDKDGVFGQLPPASVSDYLPRPPTAQQFDDCCNEFWWVSNYIAKGLWRSQIVYAKTIFEKPFRTQLLQMLLWYAGAKTNFQKNLGAHGKHLPQVLEPELSQLLMQSYAGAHIEENWDALIAACDLFRQVATEVAAQFGFNYPQGDDQKVSAHLAHVRSLPASSTQIYP